MLRRLGGNLSTQGTSFSTKVMASCIVKEAPSISQVALSSEAASRLTIADGVGELILVEGVLKGGDRLYFPLPAILAHESRRGTIRLKTGFPGRESFKSEQK